MIKFRWICSLKGQWRICGSCKNLWNQRRGGELLQSIDAESFEATVLRLQSEKSIRDFIDDQNGNSENVDLLRALINLSEGYRREFNEAEDIGEDIGALLLDLMFAPKKPPPRKIDNHTTKTNSRFLFKDQHTNLENMRELAEIIDQSERYFGKFKRLKNIASMLLNFIFKYKKLSEEKFPERFSNGKFPVFYSSLDEKTVTAEVCYWHCKYFRKAVNPQRTIRRILFSCQFSGQVKDLCGCDCPNLTDSDIINGYKFCQALGEKAVQENLDGLLVPSARRRCGTNLPVFSINSLSNMHFKDRFDIVYYPAVGVARARKLDRRQ